MRKLGLVYQGSCFIGVVVGQLVRHLKVRILHGFKFSRILA